MPPRAFRLTGLQATSKLFFPSSQTILGKLSLAELRLSGISRMAQIINKFVLCAAIAALTLPGVLSSIATAQTNQSPDRDHLLNGLTILYGNRPGDPNVLLKLRINSGAAFDLAGKAGTMALLADAMFPEASTREYVTEQLGGRLDVATTYDSIDITLSGKASELERMIELMRNAVLNLNLSPENVATLREARIRQLSEKQSASVIADRAVAARLFGTYPYGSPAEGTIESVGKIERADLMMARERFVNAENATLAVIGGVERTRLMRAVRQILGPWQKGDRIVPATFRQPGAVDDRILLIDQPVAKDVQVRIAVRGLSRSDPDVVAAAQLAFIADQRWRSAVPEISTSVRHEAHALSGTFVFAATAPPAAAAKAIAAAKKLIAEMAASELSAVEIPTVMRTPGRMPIEEAMATAWQDAETYKARTDPGRSIRPDDLRRVATRLFENSAPVAIVVVGNAAELQTQLGYKVELRSEVPETKPTPSPSPSQKKP